MAVGQHFQTILTTSDYFSNAVLWLPLMLITLYFTLDWSSLLGKGIVKPFGLNWGSLFWFLIIIVWPIAALFLPFNGLSAWIWALALLWMMYGNHLLPFENAADDGFRLLRRALLVLPVIGALLFTHGYSHGREALRSFDDPYDLELKSGGTIHRIALRTFDKGILVRDAVSYRIEFVRWDDISRLARAGTLSTLPLACRWFGWYCPAAPEP